MKDIPALKIVLDETGLFPSDMLPDMVSEYLCNEKSHVVWLTCEVGGEAAGFCYAAPEKLTDGTWNMLAIAVHPSKQSNGCGRAIVRRLEALLHDRGHRVLIADTSGKDEFALTREFYRKSGYSEEARIRHFWAVDDDKVVFWKLLSWPNCGQCGHLGRTANLHGSSDRYLWRHRLNRAQAVLMDPRT
jgi:ribosomal protein S18 acetylase RimI-like enzyme